MKSVILEILLNNLLIFIHSRVKIAKIQNKEKECKETHKGHVFLIKMIRMIFNRKTNSLKNI